MCLATMRNCVVRPVSKLVGAPCGEHRKKKGMLDLDLATHLGRERMESIPRHLSRGREGYSQATANT